jgi:hypothetical protein
MAAALHSAHNLTSNTSRHLKQVDNSAQFLRQEIAIFGYFVLSGSTKERDAHDNDGSLNAFTCYFCGSNLHR